MVRIAFSNATMHQHISECCKMCISGYAFLSAFGMTCSLKKLNDNTEKAYFKFVVRRIIKLEASLIFIYIVAILFKRFVMIESIRKVYENGNGFSFTCLIIDMLGMAEYFGTPTVNITWWYMSYALLLVVMMPFIYILYYFFTEHIYSLKYDWLMLIVMLSLCSMVSMALEFVKKLCGYNKLTNNMVLLCEKTIENIDMPTLHDNT